MKACPLCLSSEVYASHREGLLERTLLTRIGVLPFRCGDCQTRYYRFAWNDPRRRARARASDATLPIERPRPPRWQLQVEATVSFDRPESGPVSLKGTTENASLEGASVRLSERVPEGSAVELSLEGGPASRGTVRWSRADGEHDVVHGVRLNQPWPAHSLSSRPLRRLRRRRFARRLLIGVIGLGVIALAAWALVWFMDASRGYAPKFYEPKDTERERAELQRRLEELSKTPKP